GASTVGTSGKCAARNARRTRPMRPGPSGPAAAAPVRSRASWGAGHPPWVLLGEGETVAPALVRGAAEARCKRWQRISRAPSKAVADSPPWIEGGGFRLRWRVDSPSRRADFRVILPDGSRPRPGLPRG